MNLTETHTTKEFANATFFALLEQELADRGNVRFRVKGFSMQPMLRNNRDEVELVPYRGEELLQGDICLFKFRGGHILHRYLHTEGDILYFQGDNVVTHGECCRRSEVVGVVKMIYRDGQSLRPYTTSWQLRILFHRLKLRIRLLLSSCLPKSVKQRLKKLLGIK